MPRTVNEKYPEPDPGKFTWHPEDLDGFWEAPECATPCESTEPPDCKHPHA